MLKRVFCLFLCCIIVFFTFCYQTQEVHAFIPLVIGGVVIGEELVAAVATTMVAAGVVYATPDDAYRGAINAIQRGGEKFITNIKIGFDAIKDGIMPVSDDTWSAVQSHVASKYQIGQGTLVSDARYIVDLDGRCFPVSTMQEITFTSIMYRDSVSEQNFSPAIGNDGNWLILAPDRTGYMTRITAEQRDTGPLMYIKMHEGGHYRIYYEYQLNFYNPMGQDLYPAQTIDYAGNVNYLGKEIIQPNYDYKVDNVRDVKVSSTVSQVVGKTYSDVQVTTRTIAPYSASWSGTWSDCVPSGTYTFVGTGTIAGEMPGTRTGTWQGTWSTTATGERVWTGTYAGVDGLTWTGTATESIPIPQNPPAEWDYPKWKVPADTLKNKFPFSIPWDLKNAIASLVATPEAPRWTINFDARYFVGGGQIVIDFTQFEPWAKVIRWGLLIIFNLFLILATRKIIGAS